MSTSRSSQSFTFDNQDGQTVDQNFALNNLLKQRVFESYGNISQAKLFWVKKIWNNVVMLKQITFLNNAGVDPHILVYQYNNHIMTM